MKTFLTKYRTDINVFALFLYAFFLLFSYDSFCFDTITTETPLLKIGDFPLLRTEFTAFLFALTAIVGAAAGIVPRIKGKKYSSVLVALPGLILLFFTFFDVDALQKLVPSMRISHVVMTLSRISAIATGISGLFFGLALSLLNIEKHPGAIVCGVLAALLFSILAVEEKLYTLCFTSVSLILIATGISGEYFNCDCPLENTVSAPLDAIVESIERFSSVFVMTVLPLALCGYLTDTENYGNSAYFISIFAVMSGYALSNRINCKTATVISVASGIVLAGLAIAFRAFVLILITCFVAGLACGTGKCKKDNSAPWDALVSASALFTGAIVSYYVVHEISQIMSYSANRIVYLPQSNLFIPVAIALGVKLLCLSADIVLKYIKGKNHDNSLTVR